MPKKKKRGKYKAHKKKSSGGLSSKTIFTLTGLVLFGTGFALLASFIRNGDILTHINEQLLSSFGIFSYLIPINCIIFALIFWRIKSPFTRINFPVGFVVFTVSLLGLFKSGDVGLKIFTYLSSLIGTPVAFIAFILGSFIGFVVFLNVSIPSLIEKITGGMQKMPSVGGSGKAKFEPLMGRKKNIIVNESEIIEVLRQK